MTIFFSKNLTVLAAVYTTKKRLKEAPSRFSNYYLDISAYLNIAKNLNIARHIFENIELSKGKDKSEKSWKQCKEVFGDFSFLVTYRKYKQFVTKTNSQIRLPTNLFL